MTQTSTNVAENTAENTAEATKQPFSIIENEKWFNDKAPETPKEETPLLEGVDENGEENKTTKTNPLSTEDKEKAELEAKTKLEAENAAKLEKETLEAQRKELNLPETATKEEIEAAFKAKNGTAEETKTDEFEFKVPTAQEAPEDGTWKALAIARGHEVPEGFKEENGFEELFKLEEAKHKAEIEKVRNESLIQKYKPETAIKLEMLEAGIPEEEIFEPTKKLDAMLALSDVEKVRIAVEATPGITPEMVDAEMEILAQQPAVIAHRAKMIDLEINNQKELVNKSLNQRLTQYKEQKQEEISQALERDAKELETTLSSMTEFRGQPVKEDVKKYLVNNWKSGKYDQAFKDPKVVADFLMQLEFGKDLDKHYKESILSNAKKNIANQLHNTPTSLTPKSGTITKNNEPKERFSVIAKDFGG